MSRLVCVSNRVALPRGANPTGGLAVGLLSALRSSGGLWFGWSGETTSSGAAPEEPRVVTRENIRFATISLPESLHERSYSGFANGTLWPLFHYFLDGFHYADEDYAAYREVNALFARQLQPLLRDDDLVWVHDYHLIPLGGELRKSGARNRLGFFLHIPFPHFEVLRALPRYEDLLRGLLVYDVVGFQTEVDRRAFLESIEAVFGADAVVADPLVQVGGRCVRTGVFPISVDVGGLARAAARAIDSPPVRHMVEGLLDRKLIMGVDRLDYSKGLLERFASYRHFLEDYPQHHRRVTYVQIAPLGRQNVKAYARIRDALEQSAGRTNGHYADVDWTPIRYLNRNFPHATLMGFFRVARVCLVTPVRDGMNLVAKEFVAAQDPSDPGVLVLSDRAGAAKELTAALLVNPYDTRAIARAIHTALEMPLDERRARHEKLLAAIAQNDIHTWHRRFTEALLSPLLVAGNSARIGGASVA
ncbi:MAG TPA: trehalose-6-phosphate synthase [Steroidobacteraceae bacterium]|nr:trehalose-6-phosphate synthase [Steroidobacteraceae bacterium]